MSEQDGSTGTPTPPDAPPSAPNDPPPDPAKPPDLRVSAHQDLGVNVSRDLTGGGWLARGDRSNMSKLSFNVRAKPRDWQDPELAALKAPTVESSRSATPAPAPAADPSPPPAEPQAASEQTAEGDGILSRLGKLFGGK
jgi:hypothetical protein